MKNHLVILIGFLGIIGCSYDTKNNFQSEINRPVKNTGDYTRIGSQFIFLLENGTELDSVESVYLSELDIWTDVSKRWEMYFIPVVWRVLLTGEQADSQGILYPDQLHSAMSGGLQSLSYSSLYGWVNSYFLGVSNKYLFADRYWFKLDLKYGFKHSPSYLYHSFLNLSTLGWQLQPGFSIEIGLRMSPSYSYARDHYYNRGYNGFEGIVGETFWNRGDFEYFLVSKLRPFENHELGLGLHKFDYQFNYPGYQAVNPYYFSLSYSYIFDVI